MSGTLYIDSTNCITDLCKKGAEFNTDKSPFATNAGFYKHRKGFTAFYQILLSPYYNKPIDIAEIGIADAASMQLWSHLFKKANIYGFEFNNDLIAKAVKLNIPNTKYLHTDVSRFEYLDKTFADTNVLFDIIIDDSTHAREHQNNIINTCYKYLKSGGILVIEDIMRDDDIEQFFIDESEWYFHCFVTCHHENRNCNNDKLLYLIKR
jgi:SAM-dependent methyltransferase